MIKDINDVISACNRCLSNGNYTDSCKGCPYEFDDGCSVSLQKAVVQYLEELRDLKEGEEKGYRVYKI